MLFGSNTQFVLSVVTKLFLMEIWLNYTGLRQKKLVKAVKRNIDRFPVDFMFQLTNQEFKNLKFQTGTSSQWGGRRIPPYAFLEQGVAMLSSVLKSPCEKSTSADGKGGLC